VGVAISRGAEAGRGRGPGIGRRALAASDAALAGAVASRGGAPEEGGGSAGAAAGVRRSGRCARRPLSGRRPPADARPGPALGLVAAPATAEARPSRSDGRPTAGARAGVSRCPQACVGARETCDATPGRAGRPRWPRSGARPHLIFFSFATADRDPLPSPQAIEANTTPAPCPPRKGAATLADLAPREKAKVARLLRRTLDLAAENDSLRSRLAGASAGGGEAAAGVRAGAALDAAAEARSRADAAEAALAAARATCVCGACSGAAAVAGGASGGPPLPALAPVDVAAAVAARPIVFYADSSTYAFAAAVPGEERRRARAPAADPLPPPRFGADLPALVADVEAALARRGW